MFQSFDMASEPARSAGRISRLRATFDGLSIDAFVVPHADDFLGEYLPPHAERLSWLSGFTGSAGFAVVTREGAHIFSDGRYTLQLRDQTDAQVWSRHQLPDATIADALGDRDVRVGIDPWLHSIASMRRLAKAIGAENVVRLPVNPVDLIWNDQPARPSAGIVIHPVEYAGRLANAKLADAEASVREEKADLHVVCDALSFAWLFNLRGADVAHNPVPLARAILRPGRRPIAFVNERRLALSARAYLTQIADIVPERDFPRVLAELAMRKSVLLDPDRTPDAVRGIVEWAGGTSIEGTDPALHARARKNEVEIDGARNAHRRDGAAVVEFLHWLHTREPGTLTEIEAAERLERARRETGERLREPLREIAFDTIAGAGPHGAIVHYRVTHETDRTLESGELFLVDSGGQYLDGTTDITRTIAIGQPPEEARRNFTLVLKGMIAISRLRFPQGTQGLHVDAIARLSLWQHGLDYGHGTGHGVGSYGAVHEGPQGISKRSTVAIEPGMILSNEPGYYLEGEYGIRIENLILAKRSEQHAPDAPMMSFETLTLCPIDRNLIDLGILTPDERSWLDDYHRRVLSELSSLVVNEAVRSWLERACAPLEDRTEASGQRKRGAEAALISLDGAQPSLPDHAEPDDGDRADRDDRDQPEAKPGKDGEGQR